VGLACYLAQFTLLYSPWPVLQASGVLAIALIMLALLRWAPSLRLGPSAWLGRISYSLYLIHESLGVPTSGALKTIGTPDLLAFCFATGLCILVAAALFYHVEQPGATLGDVPLPNAPGAVANASASAIRLRALERTGRRHLDRAALYRSARPSADHVVCARIHNQIATLKLERDAPISVTRLAHRSLVLNADEPKILFGDPQAHWARLSIRFGDVGRSRRHKAMLRRVPEEAFGPTAARQPGGSRIVVEDEKWNDGAFAGGLHVDGS
jgi:hypothetical protein